MNKHFIKINIILCGLVILPGILLANNTRNKSESSSKTTTRPHGSTKTTVTLNQKQVQETPGGSWVNEGSATYAGSSTAVYNNSGEEVATISTKQTGNGSATTTLSTTTGRTKTVDDSIIKNSDNTATITMGNVNGNASNSNEKYQLNRVTINNKTYDKGK